MRTPSQLLIQAHLPPLRGMALQLAVKNALKRGERVIFDRGKHVPVKTCVVCQRDFTWRKKWERVWDEVSTCSKRCNKTRRKRLSDEKKKTNESMPQHDTTKFQKGMKQCNLCNKNVNLLIRCSITAKAKWLMVCGKCWNLPSVANGIVDGDKSTNPHYRYGGLWKNLHV